MSFVARPGLVKLAVIPLAFLLSGAAFYQINHGATVTVNEFSECRNVTNTHASGNALFVPTNTSGEWTSFRNNAPAGVDVAACGCTVTPGSQNFTSAGNHTFNVPCHNTLTVRVWGGGGGGRGYNSNGGAGGNSSWGGSALRGNGGAGGAASAGGSGGTASGGSTNTAGDDGENRGGSYGGAGGDSPNGGSGAARRTANGNGGNGSAPGGGGAGFRYQPVRGTFQSGAGGGGGGYATRAYAAGTYSVGASVAIVVGDQGNRGNGSGGDLFGGYGAVGRVSVSWN